MMTKPRRETKLPGTDRLGSMACRLAHERLAGCQSVPAFGVWFHGESIMPQSAGPDHDQRLKVLLKEFFEAFFLCFFPTWAAVRVPRYRLAGQGAVPGTAAGGEAAARPGGPAEAAARHHRPARA